MLRYSFPKAVIGDVVQHLDWPDGDYADNPAFCLRSECSRSIYLRLQHKILGNAASFLEPDVRSRPNGSIPNYPCLRGCIDDSNIKARKNSLFKLASKF
jgi:hypothetical protein